ncbi:type II toxin-antitoxin system prevent-host-death family antitoxin [Frankia sp. R82]|nr:type II toxin-antitoxin system prevent-host-death family antitoxin [Frankia sp. R82]MCM3882820.1 type II toxin-antitoxin system prevent-host-death family antitoxin [Frankia sp. R82]
MGGPGAREAYQATRPAFECVSVTSPSSSGASPASWPGSNGSAEPFSCDFVGGRAAAADDHEEVIITRAGHEPVVIESLDDYQSLKATVYLLCSLENARRLAISIDRLESGGGVVRDQAE